MPKIVGTSWFCAVAGEAKCRETWRTKFFPSAPQEQSSNNPIDTFVYDLMGLTPVFEAVDFCLLGVAKAPAVRNGDEVGRFASMASDSLGRIGSKELKSSQFNPWYRENCA